MIKKLYAYFNTLGGFYSVPFALDLEQDVAAEFITQSLHSADENTLKSVCEDDLYYLGTFDNVTGEVVPNKEFILHIGIVAKKILEDKSKEGVVDGK